MAQNTVILGAGIIGVSTAYYLSQSSHTPAASIHLVEYSPDLFASASGYAGGFLAADWFDGASASLGALSFKLHRQLADEHNGRDNWAYSGSTGVSVSSDRGSTGFDASHDWLFRGSSRADVRKRHEYWGRGQGPSWLAKTLGDRLALMSSSDSTAQVNPKRLCEFLLDQARDRGVHLHQPAQAMSISKDLHGELASVRIAKDDGEEMDLPCTRLLIAAGAWSQRVFSSLFPSSTEKLPITSLAGHSLVIKSPRWAAQDEGGGCHAVFASGVDGMSPEIFSRIGEEIYIAGLNDAGLDLPQRPGKSAPDPASIKRLTALTQRMLNLSDVPDDLQVIKEGLCFRPVTDRGTPIVCRLPDECLGGIATRRGDAGGVFLAAGHGPWGISQSLGTGQVMSELIESKETSADVSCLSLR